MSIARLLLGDVEPSTFFATHWGRTWVRLPGPVERFAGLYSAAELAQHAAGDLVEGTRPPLTYRVAYTDPRGATHTFSAPLEMAEVLLASGMTLSFMELEHAVPKVAKLAADVGQFLQANGPLTVTSFLSPPDHGFPWHFDYPHVFALQIEGRKRWRLGRKRVPAAPWTMEATGPRAQATFAFLEQLGMRIEPPSDDDCDEIELAPGDVLYMPPGTWHRATASGGSSCHLSLLNRPISFGRVLRAVLSAVGLRNESWRADLQRLDPAQLRAVLLQRISEVQREVATMTPERLERALSLLTTSPLARLTLLDRARDVL